MAEPLSKSAYHGATEGTEITEMRRVAPPAHASFSVADRLCDLRVLSGRLISVNSVASVALYLRDLRG